MKREKNDCGLELLEAEIGDKYALIFTRAMRTFLPNKSLLYVRENHQKISAEKKKKKLRRCFKHRFWSNVEKSTNLISK